MDSTSQQKRNKINKKIKKAIPENNQNQKGIKKLILRKDLLKSSAQSQKKLKLSDRNTIENEENIDNDNIKCIKLKKKK